MWHQVNSAIFSIDRFLALWRMQVTTQYILQCWKAAGKTPDMAEDEIPLFLCDETRGKLTDEQRAFAKERRAEMYDHCQHAVPFSVDAVPRARRGPQILLCAPVPIR